LFDIIITWWILLVNDDEYGCGCDGDVDIRLFKIFDIIGCDDYL
jgi:hypothetical protein